MSVTELLLYLLRFKNILKTRDFFFIFEFEYFTFVLFSVTNGISHFNPIVA